MKAVDVNIVAIRFLREQSPKTRHLTSAYMTKFFLRMTLLDVVQFSISDVNVVEAF